MLVFDNTQLICVERSALVSEKVKTLIHYAYAKEKANALPPTHSLSLEWLVIMADHVSDENLLIQLSEVAFVECLHSVPTKSVEPTPVHPSLGNGIERVMHLFTFLFFKKTTDVRKAVASLFLLLFDFFLFSFFLGCVCVAFCVHYVSLHGTCVGVIWKDCLTHWKPNETAQSHYCWLGEMKYITRR